MKKKNAFTLIELLAVIVVLAIIALIAVPMILKIVENAKKDAFLRSIEMLVSTTDLDIGMKYYEDKYTYTIENGNVSNLDIPVKNINEMNGSIVYNEEGKDTYAIHNNKWCVIKTESMTQAEINDYKEGDCYIPTDLSCFSYEPVYEYEIVDSDACYNYVNDEYYDNGEWYYLWYELRMDVLCQGGRGRDGETLFHMLNSDKELEKGLLENNIISRKDTNTVKITDYKGGCSKDVSIPSRLGGKEVSTIGYHAFSSKKINSVFFPSTITTIEEEAFYGNMLGPNLDLSMYTNLVHIDGFGNNKLTSFKLPDTVISLGSTFFNNNQLNGELDLTTTQIKEIAGSAFSSNQLSSVKFPATIQIIDYYCFKNNQLTSVTFYGKSDLTDVEVGYDAWGWAPGYSDANITFVNE